MSAHPLCCDCDACLNGAGGYVLPGAGATKPDPEARRKNWGEVVVPGFSSQTASGIELEAAQRRPRREKTAA